MLRSTHFDKMTSRCVKVNKSVENPSLYTIDFDAIQRLLLSFKPFLGWTGQAYKKQQTNLYPFLSFRLHSKHSICCMVFLLQTAKSILQFKS